MRKAQLTVFFILGLVMVLGGIIWWAASLETKGEGQETVSQSGLQSEQRSAQLKEYFDDCVEKESYNGLVLLGSHGGYRDIPDSFNIGDRALWQFDNANTQPFLNTTLAELEEYLELSLPECMTKEAAGLQGFSLERGLPRAKVEFANEDVSVHVNYPLTITQGDYRADYDEFSHTVKLPFRKIFEVATELNEHALLPEFKPEVPLEGANSYGYALSYERTSPEMILFTVTDFDTVTPDTKPYLFKFLAKFGLTGLEKITLLQEESATTPAIYTYEVRSPDNLAVLYLLEGTTASLNGNSVEEITVDQGYPSSERVSGLPGNLNGGSITYVTTNPVYSFEPSGLLFNQLIPLVINYENNSATNEGVGILRAENAGQWVPVRSFDDPANRRITTYVQGFTNYSAVNCAEQPIKTAESEHVKEPSPICYAQLALTVVTLGTSLYLDGGLLNAIGSQFAGGVGFAEGLSNVASYVGGQLGAGFGTAMASTVGYTYLGLTAVSLGMSVADYVSPGIFYQNSPEQCQNYIPTCDQTVTVEKQEKDGDGMCIPESNAKVGAGQHSSVCAQVEQCDPLNRFICKKCSVKCKVSFK